MRFTNLCNRKAGGYTTFGSVWRPGEKKTPDVELINQEGENIPVQSRVTAWWPDQSVKWVNHTADSDRMGNRVELYPAEPHSEESTSKFGGQIIISETMEKYQINTGCLSMAIPKSTEGLNRELAIDICLNGEPKARSIYPVLLLENKHQDIMNKKSYSEITEALGVINSVVLEETGPIQVVVCCHGCHLCGTKRTMPFVIRMYLHRNSAELRFDHTFLFDGDEGQDYLKGMGLRTEAYLTGEVYDHQVQFASDKGVFHEAALMLASNHPRLSTEILSKQLKGLHDDYSKNKDVQTAIESLPIWERYVMCQESDQNYRIKKQTHPECCELTCEQGKHGKGAMAVSGSQGGVIMAIRDFWQKYPSGLEVHGLGGSETICTAWFFCPEGQSFDFRHYDTRSYPDTSYEGFKEVGASAYGIGVRSECSMLFTPNTPDDDRVLEFADRIQKPAVYVGDPEYYHEQGAFGHWSLPGYDTEVETWLETQLDRAFSFYQQQIIQRRWYGLFDYGDVMHTYDPVRHCWKYDVGGFAWQNTELVPTYWLWLYFLRTGREDVFTLAEAMSRHCSEVDIYHFGPLKGLGSRHNVRHWGCSCKEPRIAMAGHHRPLYYLTGDYRLGDIFDEVKDADLAMKEKLYYDEKEKGMVPHVEVRSGPDWSAFVSNWMTAYERTLDESYRRKIETGIADIAAAPFGFASGPDYFYDAESAHLIYRGEIETTPNQHLQICMGGPQVWWETANMLGDDTLNKMLSDLGYFYYLSQEEKAYKTDGKIVNRPFGWPMLATGIAAFGAGRQADREQAAKVWHILLDEVIGKGGVKGYEPVTYGQDGDGESLREIPWITTNSTAQWCLNTILCLEFIRDYANACEEVMV